MKPRVNLCRGGYIIIEKTEALTIVDVNSGSFTNLQNSRQTSLWVNYSAVHEIVKQIRLRNIGGIIVIDFIDCNNHQDQMKLLRYMSKLILKDYVRCRIIQMSELGLVELTRSRQGQSVYDAFSRKCNTCNGLGYLTFNLNKQKNINYELILDPFFNYHKRLYDRIRNLYNKVQS
jgi:ribonuclease E